MLLEAAVSCPIHDSFRVQQVAGLFDVTLAERAVERFAVEAPFGGPTSSGMLTLHSPPQHVHALASLLDEGTLIA